MNKICNVCGEDLPLESFREGKNCIGGYRHQCKKCSSKDPSKYTPRRIVKDGFKYCPKCKQELPFNLFGFSISNNMYMSAYCKECTTFKSKQQRTKIGANSARANYIQKVYNLSWEDYIYIFTEQQGKCAICKTDIYLAAADITKTAHVDHSHENGRVRGLLCGKCNSSLGGFNEDIELLQNAINYIKNTLEKV